MKDLILNLYSKPQTVFQIEEIAQMFPDTPPINLRRRLHYFVKVRKLSSPRRGIYTKNEYEPLELANKLYKPSYISLETVLAKEGVVFQYYETIFVVSYLTRAVRVNKTNIQYRHIKGEILTNLQGIESKEGYFIASVERAFLDAVYIYKNYHFDNLGVIDWKKVMELKKIYKDKAFEKRVEDYGKH